MSSNNIKLINTKTGLCFLVAILTTTMWSCRDEAICLPDLEVVYVQLVEDVVIVGAPISFVFEIRNKPGMDCDSTQSSGPFSVGLNVLFSANPNTGFSELDLGEDNRILMPSLNQGESITPSFAIEFSEPGFYQASVVADVDGDVEERNVQNNTATLEF